MCGISGILSKNYNPHILTNLVKEMNEELSHRGPDDTGYYLNQELGIFFWTYEIVYSGSFAAWSSTNEVLLWKLYNCF